MDYFVGAYASSPCVTGWDEKLETQYYAELKKLSHIRGLEHPFLGEHIHAHDDQWFFDNIDPTWDYVFTCVPGNMSNLSKNPEFGLASTSQTGREAALAFMKKACEAIAKLNMQLGRQAVVAIEIQTAPNQTKAKSSVQALLESLAVMQAWNWQGARIVIEHCDTYIEGQTPAKGFLTIEEELKAIKRHNSQYSANLGMVINWGRSAIETRSVQGVLDHIHQAREAGVFSGLMFSGVSEKPTAYGEWADTHMPASALSAAYIGEPESLMSAQNMHMCMRAAETKDCEIMGIKLGIRPKTHDVSYRIAQNKNALAILAAY